MARLGQTVAVVNQSGRVVSNSKSLVGVFKEAKFLYAERKAEIKAKRADQRDEQLAREGLDDLSIAETEPRPSPRHRKKSHSKRSGRPAANRGVTDTHYTSGRAASEEGSPPPPYGMHRRHTTGDIIRSSSSDKRAPHSRACSITYSEAEQGGYFFDNPNTPAGAGRVRDEYDDSMDEDEANLAYGDLPSPPPQNREVVLRKKMSNLTRLLDEANCLQHSVTTMIETLQQDPDRLAAVGLALADISNMARTMSPGALMAMKASFPAVLALLASPQFMIAGGVAIGVTVVALGGYKIIKKIKAQRESDELIDGGRGGGIRAMLGKGGRHVDEIREIGGDLSRIELWRRGIAEAEAGSVGTSVDGEFITENAGRQLVDEGVLRPEQTGLRREDGRRPSKHGHRHRREPSGSKTEKAKEKTKEKTKEKDRKRIKDVDDRGSERGRGHRSKSERSERSDAAGREKRPSTKHRESSGLKSLFRK